MELRVSQCQVEIIYSVLEEKNRNSGIRLRINEYLMDMVAYSGKLIRSVNFVMEIRMGVESRVRIIRIEEVIILFTFIWICTKVFGS